MIAVFACLGFLSPANRGALMTCALVLWVCLGTPAGYVSARIYKSKYFIDKEDFNICTVSNTHTQTHTHTSTYNRLALLWCDIYLRNCITIFV